MRSPLNLATRPARNERLPLLLFAVAAGLLVAATAGHALTVTRLASTAATSLDDEVVRLTAEQEALREKDRALRGLRVDKATIERWTALKGLVDQRAFSWTGLLSRLEVALPPDVRLKSIAPEFRKGRHSLTLEAVARTAEDAVPLVKVLEDRPEFEDVFLEQIGEGSSDVSCRYRLTYLPDVPGAAAPPVPPSPALARALGAEAGP